MAKKPQTTELHVTAGFEGIDQPVELYHLVDAEQIKRVSREQLEKDIGERLETVSLAPTPKLYRAFLDFSMVKPQGTAHFDYANVIVEAHLPYCLHLPNGCEMVVDIPEQKIRGLVRFQKVWTKRAEVKGRKSDNIDYYAANLVTSFQSFSIETPSFPVRPEEGWDQFFTGTNIERIKDQNGTFRYSRLFIQFDPNISADRLSNFDHLSKKEVTTLLDEIADLALSIVNRIIDCYRYVTKQEYVERLGALSINTIYFNKENQGFRIARLVPGIESAIMNRSKKEIDEIERLLKDGKFIPLHELLVLDSHAAFQKKQFTLAIVESFQALEIMLENILISCLKAQGLSQSEYEAQLERCWKTKERLNVLLKQTKGHALNENSALWQQWHTNYDKVRNEVIHQGRQASSGETEKTLKTNEDVIAWIQSL